MKRPLWLPVGVFLLCAAVYGAAGPGRIDMIDGQYRFEVAKNILDYHSVQIGDVYLGGAVHGVLGEYSSYGISGSLVALPLVLLSRAIGPPSIERDQFFFSFTSSVFGAASAALLFLFYTTLGVEPRRALSWTLVAAFATLLFPGSVTVFDQAQHGFFILLACYCAYLGARRDSMALMAAGGAALAVLVNFQETYAIVIPTVAVAALANLGTTPAARRRAFERVFVFLFVAGVGIIAWAGFNSFRYGSLLFSGKGVNHPSPLGNPLIGLPGLLISPGKSIFLYSPAVIVALAGIRALLRRDRALGLAVGSTVLVHLAMISMLSFYGGDWCWGPRYFVSTLPMLALAMPFAPIAATPARRIAAGALVGVSFVIQLLGLSLDHHRFFYARSLPAFFWYTDRTFYFHESALFARPGEILDSIRTGGVPPEAIAFRPGPYPELLTYAVFGGWNQDGLPSPQWMRRYAVFWLPRPWALWMTSIDAARRPIDIGAGLAVLMALAAGGLAAIAAGLRHELALERQHAG
jgi:hypothetical protein